MVSCKFCNTELIHSFINLGLSPLANSFVEKDQLNSPESFYPLHSMICENCLLVQVEELVSPESIFKDYLYFSSYSSSWLDHCKNFFESSVKSYNLNKDSLVVEVASNDGYMLQYYNAINIPVLGIEPAINVAKVAQEKGINTHCDFLNSNSSKTITNKYGKADLVIANNVLAHVPDINDFVKSLKDLIKPSGIISIEVPHILSLIKNNQFDTIYHEHFFYFSLLTLKKVFQSHSLKVLDVEKIVTHGGSIRITISHDIATYSVSKNVQEILSEEIYFGLSNITTYIEFKHKVYQLKAEILKFLYQAKSNKKIIAAYGAPAKGNTLLNYCHITEDLICCTTDLNEHKQGLYLPGSRLPVLSIHEMLELKPDYILILPWNLKNEIISSLKDKIPEKTKFLTVVPEVNLIDEH